MKDTDKVMPFAETDKRKEDAKMNASTKKAAIPGKTAGEFLSRGMSIAGYTSGMDDVFSTSPKPQSKRTFLADIDEGNKSGAFSEATSHRHKINPACRRRIKTLRQEYLRRIEESEGGIGDGC